LPAHRRKGVGKADIAGAGNILRRTRRRVRLFFMDERGGDVESTPGTVDRVVSATYAELRVLAHARLSRAAPLTLLDTTALVHECYLRLLKLGELKAIERGRFLSYAGHAMRTIIIDFVRQRASQRRGGGLLVDITLDNLPDLSAGAEELLAIDAALLSLARLDERLVQVVELRYFAGLTYDEIASALGIDERTVRRDWDKARALLFVELQQR
jgi:RNA polymerase sigma factor (TIGR02999 family)